ncbi:MAG: divalent-cation tolerance protein CutA [Gammaproteobacteria bacterium]|nr:divalent-cation tolerance protein CutA [Gammaproteobacteria bacterium]
MPNHYLVITSWPDLDAARQQAQSWVQKKIAASVNILPLMDSIYHWNGEIRHGKEHKIFIKTSSACIDELRREIRAAHPYVIAEILCFEIDSGDPDYLDWIKLSTQ